MGENKGVDATLTFDPQGHLQGYKDKLVFHIVGLAIVFYITGKK